MRIFEGFQKGVNLGGWISQFDKYDHEHFKTFIVEEDIANIASMGFDHIRIPVDYNVIQAEDESVLEEGYAYLENAVAWCKKHGLNMMIDLHEIYGYSFDPLKKDMDREKFFYDDELQARFFRLWETIATRFGKYSDMVSFELLNEVVLEDVYEAWNKVVAKAIKHIRAIAPDTYIVVGGVCYNNVTCVKKLDPPADDKIVYNFHCYEPLIFTHQKAYWVDWKDEESAKTSVSYPNTLEHYRDMSKALSKDLSGAIFEENISEIGPQFFEDIFSTAIEAAEKYDVPLYCGEYGVIDQAPLEDALCWLKDINKAFTKYGIGRSLWNYKAKDFGLVDGPLKDVKEDLVNYL